MAVSEENKTLARYLREIIGGKPSVGRYWDKPERSSVDIFRADDRPDTGVVSYATLGLSDTSLELDVEGVPLRVELVMAAAAEHEAAPHILATAAFNIINDGMAIEPGTIFCDVVGMYLDDSDMKHLLFLPPFLWPLETQRLPRKTVAWLLAVPISNAERAYADEKGTDALEDVFEKEQIDIYDLSRASVL